jgi:hypothetical protein
MHSWTFVDIMKAGRGWLAQVSSSSSNSSSSITCTAAYWCKSIIKAEMAMRFCSNLKGLPLAAHFFHLNFSVVFMHAVFRAFFIAKIQGKALFQKSLQQQKRTALFFEFLCVFFSSCFFSCFLIAFFDAFFKNACLKFIDKKVIS